MTIAQFSILSNVDSITDEISMMDILKNPSCFSDFFQQCGIHYVGSYEYET
jgi:hypothetical protein